MFRAGLRYAVLSFAFTVCAALLCFSAQVSTAHAGFRADVVYSDGGSPARPCGRALTSGGRARLDVELGRAGVFTLIVDREQRVLRVLSQRLRSYVETALQGEAGDWRGVLRSASAVLMPQTLGMVSLEELECRELGREKVQGHDALRSRVAFRLGFLGSYREITVDVWEGDALAPFPLKIAVSESRETRGGSAWMEDITAVQGMAESFLVPEGFTRYTSVMDLILYAMTAF